MNLFADQTQAESEAIATQDDGNMPNLTSSSAIPIKMPEVPAAPKVEVLTSSPKDKIDPNSLPQRRQFPQTGAQPRTDSRPNNRPTPRPIQAVPRRQTGNPVGRETWRQVSFTVRGSGITPKLPDPPRPPDSSEPEKPAEKPVEETKPLTETDLMMITSVSLGEDNSLELITR